MVEDYLTLIGAISFANIAITMPIICNLFLIPPIEKNIGGKLQLSPVIYKFNFFKPWFKYVEVSTYIVLKYVMLKMGFGNKPLNRTYSALQKINYDVRLCSRVEIILSFIAVINYIIFFSIAGYFHYKKHGIN